MNIEDVNLDELCKLDDDFLKSWIKKDLITGNHFCYLEIDKRNLTETFEGDEREMLALYCQQIGMYATRYAYLAFEKEYASKLELKLLAVKKIKETFEEAEDTVWLLYEFVYVYVAENEKGEKYTTFTASFVDGVKCDYTPKILAEKIADVVPEAKNLKVGESIFVRKDIVEKMIDVMKNEKTKKN